MRYRCMDRSIWSRIFFYVFLPQKGLPREGFQGWRWLQQKDLRGVGGWNRLERPHGDPTVACSSCGALPPALAPPGPCSATVTRRDRVWLGPFIVKRLERFQSKIYTKKYINSLFFVFFPEIKRNANSRRTH